MNIDIYNNIVKINVTKVIFDNIMPHSISENISGSGAGFFIDNEGHILTAAHVIEDSINIRINLPEEGKLNYDAKIISVLPDFDLAIIKILEYQNKYFLKLGDSDTVNIGDRINALGYPENSDVPLGTSGTVSGNREGIIQGDVPVNPGNSGGPILNNNDEVIGITSAKIMDSENSSLIIPINVYKIRSHIIMKLNSKDKKIIYKNCIGLLFSQNNKYYMDYHNIDIKILQNKGVIVSKIYNNSPLQNKINEGDIVYKINNLDIDFYGELNVKWEVGKVSISYILDRTIPNESISISFYSITEKKIIELDNIELISHDKIYKIRNYFYHIEKNRDHYEIFAGIIVMNLDLKHITTKFQNYIYLLNEYKEDIPSLIISYVFDNSKISEYYKLSRGILIDTVNNKKVTNIEEYKKALKEPIIVNNKKYICIISKNNRKFILDLHDILKQEIELIDIYRYNPSDTFSYFNKTSILNKKRISADMPLVSNEPQVEIDYHPQGTDSVDNCINNKENAFFTMYHAKWCDYCKKSLPYFQNIIKNYKNNNIKCKEIEEDTTEYKSLNPKIKELIKAFPTYIYSKGKINEIYNGDRDETSILNFLDNKYK